MLLFKHFMGVSSSAVIDSMLCLVTARGIGGDVIIYMKYLPNKIAADTKPVGIPRWII